MNSISDKYIFEALNDNTFNLQILNETLWEIKERSFNALYLAQRAIADITRIDIDMSEYNIESASRYSYNVNIDIIGQNRELYRKSEFYKKEVTVDDMLRNPSIFPNTPLLFINGLLYTNYTLSILDGMISINFIISGKNNGMSMELFNSLAYNDMDIGTFSESNVYEPGDYIVYTYPNGIRKVLECTNKTTGLFNKDSWKKATGTGHMTLFVIPTFSSLYDDEYNHYILKDSLSIGLQFQHGSKKYQNDTVPKAGGFAFVTTDSNLGSRYQLLDGVLTEHIGQTAYRFKYSLSQSQIDSILKAREDGPRPCNLRLMHLTNYMDRLVLDKDETYFELPILDYPVPIENMILFSVSEDGQVFFDHTATIKQHYPNIYSVNKSGTYKSIVYIMYVDIGPDINKGYYNELKVYYNNTKNILNKYKDATISEKIKNYKHIEVVYDIEDYKQSGYSPDHLDYKINKFKSLVSKNGEFYRWYLKRLNMKNDRFSIDVSGIDLSERIKRDNHSEITDPTNMKTFDEDRYLIMIRPDCDDDIVIFIDNKLYTPDVMYRVGEDILVYIPTDKLSESSNIYIEKLEDIYIRQKLEISDQYIHVSIPQNLNVSTNDIFLSISTNDGEKYLYNIPGEEKIFNMYVKSSSGEYIPIEPSAFYTHKDIYIEILDETLKNSEIYFNVNKLGLIYSQIGNPRFEINLPINNDPRNIHLFKNGLRIPDEARYIKFSEFINGPHEIRVDLIADEDDIFTLLINHDKYTKVAEIDKIPNTGLIDLTDMIDKPFDLEWHDIFVNGLKLNETNIEYISPYVIVVKNINSLRHFIVYEKNLDSGMLTPDTKDDVNTFQNELVDIIPDKPIEDELPDISDDIVLDYIGFVDSYLINIDFINPDIQQVTTEMVSEYNFIVDINENIFIDPDVKIKTSGHIMIDPDDEYGSTDPSVVIFSVLTENNTLVLTQQDDSYASVIDNGALILKCINNVSGAPYTSFIENDVLIFKYENKGEY